MFKLVLISVGFLGAIQEILSIGQNLSLGIVLALPPQHIMPAFAAGTFREQRVEEGKLTGFLRAHFAVFVQAWLSTVSS